ncbi:MAG: cytidine deaminase [Candidatus Parvarchaeota archaeon]
MVISGNTKVGAAVLSSSMRIFSGCNIEHRYRSHDIHAETNAIGNMVAAGEKELLAILIVAVKESFLPCGACMDWIFEMGGPGCLVGFQNREGGTIKTFRAHQLMPHYPR